VSDRRILLVCFSLVAATVLACKVPVFRYALERWPVDSYRMVAIVEGQQSDSVRKAIAKLNSLDESNVNIETELIDLSTLSEEQLWQLEDFDGSAATPLLQVFYPQKEGQRIKCWQGDLTESNLTDWATSPLREQIGDDLVTGVSAVFLLVDGTDKAQNDQLAARLQNSLSAAADEIKIPDGVIPRIEANQYLQDHREATMDDVLRSDVPLKVDFQLRRLARDDPKEAALLAMVHGLTREREEPILVPIFGRGRMLDAMQAADCDDEVILNACRYMVGECSCTVKALNPGVDLMLSVDWSGQLGQSVVMIDPKPSGQPTLVTIPGGGDPAAESESYPGAKYSGVLRLVACLVGLSMAVCLVMLARKVIGNLS
jgi:hypothetical protein